jgi:HEAT repeat protein
MAIANRPEVLAAGRQVVRPALHDADALIRLRAATLALRPEIGHADLLLPFLSDPSAEVRRTAMLAIGPEHSLLADDDLLNWLHDPDAEVRQLTETALRSRGLGPREIRLGRLLTHPRPSARLELLVLLRDDGELDLNTWLRRLSEDPAPAVRAAATRLADERQVFQLADRLSEMATADPDFTVRQAAAYYRRQLEPAVRPVRAP